MANFKLQIEDFVDYEFQVLAIHANYSDFRMAYFLNKQLNLKLKRKQEDVAIYNTNSKYSFFEWIDQKQHITWDLISNKSNTVLKINKETTLFSNLQNQNTIINYLLPEVKQANFILKINHGGATLNLRAVTEQIKKIPQLITVYKIPVEDLKSKENLIFS